MRPFLSWTVLAGTVLCRPVLCWTVPAVTATARSPGGSAHLRTDLPANIPIGRVGAAAIGGKVGCRAPGARELADFSRSVGSRRIA
jgi:hypothetical protein